MVYVDQKIRSVKIDESLDENDQLEQPSIISSNKVKET